MINLLWEKLGSARMIKVILFLALNMGLGLFFYGPSLASSEATTSSTSTPFSQAEALENEFGSIKELLRNDFLEDEAKHQQQLVAQQEQKTLDLERAKFQIPGKEDFWPFFTQLWLVKNAPLLKWDFEKPDYGLAESFQELLETLGYFEVKFSILLLDSPTVTHFSLPSGGQNHVFLLSVPFIRTMDLTKLEISLLLLEDFFRLEAGIFENYVMDKNFEKELGGNFFGRELNFTPVQAMLNNYTYFIFEKGFSFKQQYEVTSKMNNLLKSNLQLWQSYLGLLGKIDSLIKTNVLYKDYTKIYPSPELQIQWLTPEKKAL